VGQSYKRKKFNSTLIYPCRSFGSKNHMS